MASKRRRRYRFNVDPVVAHERAKLAANSRTTVDHYVRKLVERAPELTPEHVEKLRALLPPAADRPDAAA